ncbi:MAG: hypothetical protein ACODAJ_00565 [Planctomycetota bacterium]
MRSPLLWRRLVTALLAAGASAALAGAGEAEAPRLLICPAPVGEWKADIHDVQHVLRSAAQPLWRHFPERRLPPIIVAPRGGPIVWHRRGLDGEYYVQLNTGGTYWAQYAYQFAHEFCHILAGYEPTEKANKWFEESLCELASLYALRRMAETWRVQPPYPNWRGFAKHLRAYANDRIRKSQLPDDTTLAAWYRANKAALRKEPCDRARNNVVAVALLPLFEAEPQHWAALEDLNAAACKQPRPFRRYLADWHQHAPATHQPFIVRIAAEFEIDVGASTP